MRIFKTKWFVRFARRENLEDAVLCDAVARAEKGLIDADLGGGIIKQRIARPQEGKSGGYRSIVLFRTGDRAVFAYGFPKSSRENIRKDELQGYRELAEEMLGYDRAALTKAIRAGALQEVVCDDENKKDIPE